MSPGLILPFLQLAAVPLAVADPSGCAAPSASAVILPGTGVTFDLGAAGGSETQTAACHRQIAVAPLPDLELTVPERPRDPAIFGHDALPVIGMRMSARWRDGKLLDIQSEDPRLDALAEGLDQPGIDPLQLVNMRINSQFRQTDEPIDDWASAIRTIERRGGDCEDLAVLKMALLARAGMSTDDMYLVVVRDAARRIDHAVAAVRWRDRLWVLDNRIDRGQLAEEVVDYLPIQGFSGPWTWTYGQRKRAGAGALPPIPAAGSRP